MVCSDQRGLENCNSQDSENPYTGAIGPWTVPRDASQLSETKSAPGVVLLSKQGTHTDTTQDKAVCG